MAVVTILSGTVAGSIGKVVIPLAGKSCEDGLILRDHVTLPHNAQARPNAD